MIYSEGLVVFSGISLSALEANASGPHALHIDILDCLAVLGISLSPLLIPTGRALPTPARALSGSTCQIWCQSAS